MAISSSCGFNNNKKAIARNKLSKNVYVYSNSLSLSQFELNKSILCIFRRKIQRSDDSVVFLRWLNDDWPQEKPAMTTTMIMRCSLVQLVCCFMCEFELSLGFLSVLRGSMESDIFGSSQRSYNEFFVFYFMSIISIC